MLLDEATLMATYATHLPQAYDHDDIPDVDFTLWSVVVSYTTLCPRLGNELSIISTCEEDGGTAIREHLMIPSAGPAALGRPYNVILVPAGSDVDIEPTLEVTYDTED